MAGRIRDEDVAAVRDATRIDEVIGEYVTLRRAGGGTLKGLCPFHDEKTPSFHVTPARGFFHCFGCGEGGDAIGFLQKTEHMSFPEAVERLADRIGYQLQYEEDPGGRRAGAARAVREEKTRLVDAHRAAAEFYAEQLGTTQEAQTGRDFLLERHFDAAAAQHFGLGYAPRDGQALRRHLHGRGFSDVELLKAGLVSRGGNEPWDRFRGRLLWPIRDMMGEVVGFGARRLYDDDRIEAKYLNTAETPIYRKSHLLYGLDLAKRAIARDNIVVVVEGYTDVMACHLAGVPHAVATCGTAFGSDHIALLRRLLIDVEGTGAEVVFTFDGDAAGQKAALRAYQNEAEWIAQTSVAVAPDGQDPCDLRINAGDAAVRDLVAGRLPLVEFALRAAVDESNLATIEGRGQARRRVIPMVAAVRDAYARDAYARKVAGWIGVDDADLLQEVRAAARARGTAARGRGGATGGRAGSARGAGGRGAADLRRADGRSGAARGGPGADRGGGPAAPGPALFLDHAGAHPQALPVERTVLMGAIQSPVLVGAAFDALPDEAFDSPLHRAVRRAIRAAGPTQGQEGDAAWLDRLRAAAAADPVTGAQVAHTIAELSVTPIQAPDDAVPRYLRALVLRLHERVVSRQIDVQKAALHRIDPVADPEGFRTLMDQLMRLESYRRALRERAADGVV